MNTKKLLGGMAIVAILASMLFMCAESIRRGHYKYEMREIITSGKHATVRNLQSSPGEFHFFISHQGVYYFDSSQGTVWRLTDWSQLCREHQMLVATQLKEMEKREKWNSGK